jgi:hypothetical protein
MSAMASDAFERGIALQAEILIQRAMEDGQFENLPGAGRPLAILSEPYSENWWTKAFLKREHLDQELRARFAWKDPLV